MVLITMIGASVRGARFPSTLKREAAHSCEIIIRSYKTGWYADRGLNPVPSEYELGMHGHRHDEDNLVSDVSYSCK